MNTIEKFLQLPDDPAEEIINNTAHELEMLNFSPILLIPAPRFLYLTKNELISEVERITDLADDALPEYDKSSINSPAEFRQKHIEMLYFNYELLTRLRAENPEAWDYVHELYEDD